MQILTYTVRIEPAEEGGYGVYVPALAGCVTQGDTYEEAVAMAQEAIEGFVEALALAGEPVPTEPQPNQPTTVAVRVQVPVASCVGYRASGRELGVALGRASFVRHRKKGSHLYLWHLKRRRMNVVPMHPGDIHRNLLGAILKHSIRTMETVALPPIMVVIDDFITTIVRRRRPIRVVQAAVFALFATACGSDRPSISAANVSSSTVRSLTCRYADGSTYFLVGTDCPFPPDRISSLTNPVDRMVAEVLSGRRPDETLLQKSLLIYFGSYKIHPPECTYDDQNVHCSAWIDECYTTKALTSLNQAASLTGRILSSIHRVASGSISGEVYDTKEFAELHDGIIHKVRLKRSFYSPLLFAVTSGCIGSGKTWQVVGLRAEACSECAKLR